MQHLIKHLRQKSVNSEDTEPAAAIEEKVQLSDKTVSNEPAPDRIGFEIASLVWVGHAALMYARG